METMNEITIAHIINPVMVKEDSDLFKAQPITFETMKTARDTDGNGVNVELWAAVYPEDEAIVPGDFSKTPPLEKSIPDPCTSPGHTRQKKLPLIKEILDRLYEKSSAGYFIYTNVDIALTPGFYKEVGKIIEKGYDGFVINRRTISSRYWEIKDIPLMMAEAKKGEKHPGYDCFIFKRSAYKNYELGTGCVGANWIGRILISNIMAFANKFKIFKNLSLTFHIGDERRWLEREHNDYNRHNETQLLMILNNLVGKKGVKNKKILNRFYRYHLRNQQSRRHIPADLVERNSPRHRLPDKPGNIYHTEFRGSHSWEKYNRQPIRQDPIFIVGYPRSGTTLVQALVATQANIVSFNETHFFNIAGRFLTVKGDRISAGCIDRVVEKIRERVTFSENAREHIKQLAQTGGISVKMLFEIIVIDNLITRVEYKNLEHVRWMEKTPDHVLFLDTIFKFYPRAQVIYVMRHPEKAIISRRKHFFFADEASWPIEKHVQQWLQNAAAMEKFKKSRPGSAAMVRLEDITRAVGEEMQRICDFLGIAFDKNRLNNYKEIAKTLVYPWEDWKNNAAKDISYSTALNKGNHLSDEDKKKLSIMAGKELKTYGYDSSARPVKNLVNRVVRKNVLKMKQLIAKCHHKIHNSVSLFFSTR